VFFAPFRICFLVFVLFLFVSEEMPTNVPSDGFTAAGTKRNRKPEIDRRSTKPRNTIHTWLNSTTPTTTSNKFGVLSVEEDVEQNVTGADNETSETQPTDKVLKPPPIFVHWKDKIQPLTQLLEISAANGYLIRVLYDKQVKVQPKSSENYSAIIKALKENGTQFHTYQMKQDRSYRVVLKNMHHSTDTKDIAEELLKKNHKVRHIHNMLERVTKNPLPMFMVELEPKNNNRDIYDIDVLLQCIVTFEPPYHKRETPQCTKCQRYNHTKNWCNYSSRCVKCAGDHATSDCPRKEKSSEVKCVLCEGNHPANYRGCIVHKELQRKKFPAIRPKVTSTLAPEFPIQPSNPVQKGLSYAQATIGRKMSPPQATAPITHEPPQTQIKQTEQSNDLFELKQMMKTLMEQMGTMLHLLTAVIAKMT
jgi:hypothetical protein